MKKLFIIFIIILALLSLLVAGFFYLKDIFVPKTLRVLIEKSVNDSTNLKISIGSITYELFHGVVIKDIVLFEKDQPAEQGPISITKISFNVLLLPSLKGKSIIIPCLYIEQPIFSLERLKDKTWNVEHFLKKTSITQNQPNIVIAKIKVLKGNITLKDNYASPSLTKQLVNVEADISPGGFSDIGFKLKAQAPDKTMQGDIAIGGRFNTKKQILAANCEAKELEVTQILQYFKLPNLTINALALENTKTALKFSFADKNLILKSKTQLGTFDFTSSEISSLGQAKGTLDTRIKFVAEKPVISSLAGQIELWDVKISGLENIGSLDKIKTKISLAQNIIKLDNFEGYWQKNKIKADAQAHLDIIAVQDEYRRQILSVNAQCDSLPLQKIINLLPKEKTQVIENFSGQADLKAHFEICTPDEPERFLFALTANLKDGELNLTNMDQKISKIYGAISAENNKANWNNLRFSAYNQDFISSGALTDFKSPKANLILASKLFKASANLAWQDNSLVIKELEATSFGSSLKASGTATLTKENGLFLNLDSGLNIASQDLPRWLPQLQETFKQLSPEGTIVIKAQINGPALSFTDWNLKLKAESEAFKIYGLNLLNIVLNYSQAEHVVSEISTAFDFYGGKFTLSGNGTMPTQDWDININANLDNTDIAKLKLDTDFKDKDVSGLLSAKTQINLKKPLPDSITGDGEISIKDGSIWEMRPLRGLGEFLLLPAFSHILFSQGSATFTIKDRQITTGDLTLASPQMNLKGSGSLGFDGGLDFEVYCEFSEKYLQNSDDLRRLITNFFAQLNQYITVKVTGNIQKPQYKIVPINVKTILDPLKQLLGVE
jgi:hypothetical protein